jgi:curved DNA-binding protein CbpA
VAEGTSVTANLRAFADRVYPALDERSYYQLLNVDAAAELGAIRAAYYKIAAQLHPDRFHSLGDAALKDRLETIYARNCEAYRVLSHAERRAAYDRELAGGRLRLAPGAPAPAAAPRNPEDALKHAEAKKFFRLAMICLGKKDLRGALMNFNFARTFEPGAEVIRDKIAEVQAALRGGGAGGPK